jgi:hypothetical protein
MTQERTPRSTQGRETEQRKSDAWMEPSLLPVPDPKPGWTHKWVRTSTLGNADVTNVSKKFRSGWVVCSREDYPELMIMSDINSQFKDGFEVGGLLLCKMPEEMAQKRRDHYKGVAQGQMETVDNSYLNENDPRMPMLKPERKTRTSFGRD